VQTLVVQTPEDLLTCLDIRREVFIEEQGVPEELEIDEQDVIGVGTHVLVKDQTGHAVATARFQKYNDTTAKIQRVAVRKQGRGKGYGNAVMVAIESAARNQGFEKAILDAQCSAEGFYRRLGYTLVSEERFLDAGIEHVRMEKRL